MNEHDLREALRTTMAVTSQRPAMNGSAVLNAAHRAERKRKATIAGLGAAAAVAAISTGAFLLPGLGGSDPAGGIGVGAHGTTSSAGPVTVTETSGRPTTSAGRESDKPE